MKQNQLLIVIISAAITSSTLILSTTSAQATAEKNQNSIANNKTEDTSNSMDGSVVLGGLLVGFVYLLSRPEQEKNIK